MQITLFTGIDSNFHSKFAFKMCVNLTATFEKISYYFIYTNHFDRPGIKTTICKINNFFVVTSICPKCYCTQSSCVKNSCGEI